MRGEKGDGGKVKEGRNGEGKSGRVEKVKGEGGG